MSVSRARSWTRARASDCIHHARKFRQHAIASVLHDPAVVFLDFRIDQLAQMRPEPFVRAFLIGTHQARIAHHIGGEDRRETAGGGRSGHGSGGANSHAEFNLLRAGSANLMRPADRAGLRSEIEGQDEFHDQTVGTCCEAVPDAEFGAHRAALIIGHREKELLLSKQRREMAEAAEIGIVQLGRTSV